MSGKLRLGIIGCGDFLRCQQDDLSHSTRVSVTKLFDTRDASARKFAELLGGSVAGSADDVIASKDVDIVCAFVPPFVRKDIVLKAAAAGKHVIATKPLAPTVEECRAMRDAVAKAGVVGAVLYRRTGNAVVETLKTLFDSGEIGKLVLYKEEWTHHYPQWNTWATDPVRNGGPFMDAMVHNLNIARYLMGRSETRVSVFSDNHVQSLACNDTEFMKLDFVEHGSAHLFITWAADLAVESTEGNFREHIGTCAMVSSKGWYVTEARDDQGHAIVASRLGATKRYPIRDIGSTTYDDIALAASESRPLPPRIVSMAEASEDIRILLDGLRGKGAPVAIEHTR